MSGVAFNAISWPLAVWTLAALSDLDAQITALGIRFFFEQGTEFQMLG